jgi:hypothetical protein
LQKETETLAHGQARPDRDHRRLEPALDCLLGRQQTFHHHAARVGSEAALAKRRVIVGGFLLLKKLFILFAFNI